MSLSNCALCRAIGETCMDCEPEFDMPPQAGHAVPQWLRDQFSAIEDEAMRLGGCAVFTQMRTKVQAYFEMLRADLSYAVVLAERTQLKAENERLQRFETAYKEFSDKTDWVRPNAATHELGMHVADILRKRCDDLTAHCQAQADEIVRLRKDAERLNWLDGKYINIVEGQTMLDPHGELVAHEWSIRGPFSEVRDAIDDAMAEEQP